MPRPEPSFFSPFQENRVFEIDSIRYRTGSPRDLDALFELELEWPNEIRAEKEKLRRRLEIFPEGVVLAETLHSGTFLGALSTQRVRATNEDERNKVFMSGWDVLTDYEWMTHHTNDGEVLDLMALVVRRQFRHRSIGSRLLYCSLANAAVQTPPPKWAISNIRLPGFSIAKKNKPDLTPEAYVEMRTDPVLLFHKKAGGRLVGVFEGQASDSESEGYGARIDHSELLNQFLAQISPE